MGAGDATSAVPISAGEADHAFAGLETYDRLVLAVSGGADSTALMHLVVAWAARHGIATGRQRVLTVDHALRPGSAREAEGVAAAASALGLSHNTLTSDQPPRDQPFTQVWARDLRYRLLTAGSLEGWPQGDRVVLLTAHHQDDQAETVLMRLARGTGVDGLAGIPVWRTLAPHLDLVRPLLTFSKARLVATLQAQGVVWSEDPSNANARFERVALRDADAAAARARLGLSTSHLGLIAHRSARASEALDFAATVALTHSTLLTFSPLGFARLSWLDLLCKPAEIRLRVLLRVLAWLSPQAPALGQLEALTEGRNWTSLAGLTLQHCAFVEDGDHILLLPERGRLPRVSVDAGSAVRFGPFDCAPPPGAPPLTLGPLDETGLKALKTQDHPIPASPRATLLVQPALFDAEGELQSAPTLGYRPEHLSAVLRPKNW